MYINHNKLKKYPLSPQDYFFLAAIKNKEQEYLQQLTEEDYSRFEELSLVKYIKGTKKNLSQSELVRIDKKGEEILKDISTSGEISEDIIILCDWLKNLYKGRSNGLIKNMAETRRRVQWYSDETGLVKNKLATLLSCFASDSYTPDSGQTFNEFKESNPRAFYHNMVDNIAYSPPNNFALHYTLENSPLEKYKEDNLEFIEKVWAKNGLTDE